MNVIKIITIVGARPQFIKAAMISKAIDSYNHSRLISQQITEIIIHTGQHYDDNMSGIFFDQLDMTKPQYNLGVGSGNHGQQTAKMLEAIENIMIEEIPDWVIVYGDTNSTLAGALAASKLNIPIAHIEAGLRSFNRKMPEEINRIVTDHVSNCLFVPTKTAYKNLLNEGFQLEQIYNVGDVMYDATEYYRNIAKKSNSILKEINLETKSYILATIHRAENTNNASKIRTIMEGLSMVAETTNVVLPLHPRTRNILINQPQFRKLMGKIHLIEPVGYFDMLILESNACVIVTDSGGVQKEAYFHKVPCVTLREETEWIELVDLGWNLVVPPNDATIIKNSIVERIATTGEYSRNIFGEANSADLIIKILTNKSLLKGSHSL